MKIVNAVGDYFLEFVNGVEVFAGGDGERGFAGNAGVAFDVVGDGGFLEPVNVVLGEGAPDEGEDGGATAFSDGVGVADAFFAGIGRDAVHDEREVTDLAVGRVGHDFGKWDVEKAGGEAADACQSMVIDE